MGAIKLECVTLEQVRSELKYAQLLERMGFNERLFKFNEKELYKQTMEVICNYVYNCVGNQTIQEFTNDLINDVSKREHMYQYFKSESFYFLRNYF